ncbi:hypothetical protein Hanom_Chr10g00882711 [Helianthus anomalus]
MIGFDQFKTWFRLVRFRLDQFQSVGLQTDFNPSVHFWLKQTSFRTGFFHLHQHLIHATYNNLVSSRLKKDPYFDRLKTLMHLQDRLASLECQPRLLSKG